MILTRRTASGGGKSVLTVHDKLSGSFLGCVQSLVFSSAHQLLPVVLGRQGPGHVLPDGQQVAAGLLGYDVLVDAS